MFVPSVRQTAVPSVIQIHAREEKLKELVGQCHDHATELECSRDTH